MNRAAFAENGYSKGRVLQHVLQRPHTLSPPTDGSTSSAATTCQSDNGLYKGNIFDPEQRRGEAQAAVHRGELEQDPFGLALFARDRSQFYATAIPGPAEYPALGPSTEIRPLVSVRRLRCRRHSAGRRRPSTGQLRGTPIPPASRRAPEPEPDGHGVHASRVNQVVPEVYDRRPIGTSRGKRPDGVSAVPAARGRRYGPGKDDWKVGTFDGEMDYGTRHPGGAKFGIGGGTLTSERTTWCLDVWRH